MRYEELVDLMSRFDASRLTLVVHPEDEEEIIEAVREIGNQALRRGTVILAPSIVTSKMVDLGQILIMQPKEASGGR